MLLHTSRPPILTLLQLRTPQKLRRSIERVYHRVGHEERDRARGCRARTIVDTLLDGCPGRRWGLLGPVIVVQIWRDLADIGSLPRCG